MKNKIKLLGYYFIIFFLAYVIANKAINLESFRSNIFKTGLFTYNRAKYISVLVIVVESLMLLLIIFRKKIGLRLFPIMIFTFTLYITYLYFRGRYEVCGCGGILNGLSFGKHFLINMGLILLSLFVKKS